MKSFKIFLLIIVAMLYSTTSSACDCEPLDGERWKPETVKKHLEASGLIFLGETISSKGDKFSMKVLDIFKGEIEGDTIYGKVTNSCTYAPGEGLWIVYAVVGEDGKIELDLCSLTRNLTELESNPPPPPPMPGENISSAEQEEIIKAHNMKMLPLHLKNWINEYVILVGYRKSKLKQAEPTDSKEYNLSYVALGISVLALLIAIFKRKA